MTDNYFEKNPGSTDDFMASRSMQLRFDELEAQHLRLHPYLAASESLGRQASAETVAIANSQIPGPEVLEAPATSQS